MKMRTEIKLKTKKTKSGNEKKGMKTEYGEENGFLKQRP